jgi:hypothetical protein
VGRIKNISGELPFDSSDGRVLCEWKRQCRVESNRIESIAYNAADRQPPNHLFADLVGLGVCRDTYTYYVVGNLSSRRKKQEKKRNFTSLIEQSNELVAMCTGRDARNTERIKDTQCHAWPSMQWNAMEYDKMQ